MKMINFTCTEQEKQRIEKFKAEKHIAIGPLSRSLLLKFMESEGY